MSKPSKPTPTTPQTPLPIRDRVKELRRVRASDLADNANNWRLHPHCDTAVATSLAIL